ncbi:hypothetical protein IAR55_003825 [Kwoniella newhampshirensis]|uniref:PCI domain-containing protein n=1 Tax=Kwoniella newhampshirensis TaxID=1651941 RepID=A0AAW0YKU3_9TREE
MTDLTSRLEPYLLLARSTKGAAAAKVIEDATAASGVYVFAELLELPNIQQLSTDPSFSGHYHLVRLFAFGTLADYEANTSIYPSLTCTHLVKLKHLTLVSLALQQRSLRYDQLLSALGIDSIRQLEDLIIDVIYAGLLGGKMHHHEKVLHVDWAAGRDLEDADLVKVQAGLENWCKTAESLLSALDAQIDHVRRTSAAETEYLNGYRNKRDLDYQEMANDIRSRGGPGSKGGKGDVPLPSGALEGSGAEFSHETLLAAIASGSGGALGGRNLTRNLSNPEEVGSLRSTKRSRD